MTTEMELKKDVIWQEIGKTIVDVWSRSKGAELERLKQFIESEFNVTTKWEIKDFYDKIYLLKFENLPDEIEEHLEKFYEFYGKDVFIALFFARDINKYRNDDYLSDWFKGEKYVVGIGPKLVIFPLASLSENVKIVLVVEESYRLFR
ncbi:MAG: hypothetical protein RMI04_08865 [Thermofilaceae archaeon]|nr:hypothetical protein [Thermofilaceae archaeon]